MLHGTLLRVMLACVVGVGFASASRAVDFPLKDDEHTELGDHRRMESTASLSNEGTVVIDTKTWTDKRFKGFTGGVTVFVMDKDGNYLHHTVLQRYGVDGRGTGRPSKRNTVYTEKVPAGVIEKAASIVIWQGLTPKDRLDDQIAKALAISKAVKQIIDDLD